MYHFAAIHKCRICASRVKKKRFFLVEIINSLQKTITRVMLISPLKLPARQYVWCVGDATGPGHGWGSENKWGMKEAGRESKAEEAEQQRVTRRDKWQIAYSGKTLTKCSDKRRQMPQIYNTPKAAPCTMRAVASILSLVPNDAIHFLLWDAWRYKGPTILSQTIFHALKVSTLYTTLTHTCKPKMRFPTAANLLHFRQQK